MIQEQSNGLPKSATESSSLVATREAIAEALYVANRRNLLTFDEAKASDRHDQTMQVERAYKNADAVLGVVREVGDVEAEQREKDAERVAEWEPTRGWNRSTAEPDEREVEIWQHNQALAAAIRGGEKK